MQYDGQEEGHNSSNECISAINICMVMEVDTNSVSNMLHGTLTESGGGILLT